MTSEGDMGGLDFDSDCYMKVMMERTVKARSNLIVVNGSDSSGGYGLYKVSTNNYRFNADQEVYVIDLNVATGNSRFVTGMNTILFPGRSLSIAS